MFHSLGYLEQFLCHNFKLSTILDYDFDKCREILNFAYLDESANLAKFKT